MNSDPEETPPDSTVTVRSEQQVMAAYDEAIEHFVALGAEPTEADRAWAEQVSPNPEGTSPGSVPAQPPYVAISSTSSARCLMMNRASTIRDHRFGGSIFGGGSGGFS